MLEIIETHVFPQQLSTRKQKLSATRMLTQELKQEVTSTKKNQNNQPENLTYSAQVPLHKFSFTIWNAQPLAPTPKLHEDVTGYT